MWREKKTKKKKGKKNEDKEGGEEEKGGGGRGGRKTAEMRGAMRRNGCSKRRWSRRTERRLKEPQRV